MELSFTSCRACIPKTICPMNFTRGLEKRGENIPRNPSSCSRTRWAIRIRFISASLAGLATFTMPIASWPGEAIFTCPAQCFQAPQLLVPIHPSKLGIVLCRPELTERKESEQFEADEAS